MQIVGWSPAGPIICHLCWCLHSLDCYFQFLSFQTDRLEQTVKTQIRLLLEEQSDLGLHCLLFYLYPLDTFIHFSMYRKAHMSEF